MSRLDRLKEYSKPMRSGNWQGASRDMANIDRWSARATENSQCAPRSTDKAMVLPSTKMTLKDTSMPAGDGGDVEKKFKAGRADKNIVGDSPFMRDVRRTT